ncbi:LysE family transporter [Paeniroseomonas aquatica]|uniref:LysE family transporter n=1 Tax=Paeniroseomonas aquatica TaxID=373043 RepID=UPI00361508DA
MLGIALGFPAMLVLVAFGLAEVLAASPALQAALRWVGTAWMLWLAWKIATAAPATAEARAAAGR